MAVLVLAAPPSRAEVPVVGWLWIDAPPPHDAPLPFVQELERLGHKAGRTFVLESRYAAGDDSQMPRLARELLDRRPAVIVTSCGTPLRAIREISSTVPVIAGCSEPKNFLGEIASLSRPGGRTTGFTFLAPDTAGKRLQLLKELLPGLSRVGVLQNWHEQWDTYWQEMELAAPQLGLTLTKLPFDRADALDDAFAIAVRQRAQAIVVLPDTTSLGARKRIAALAIANKLATVFDTRIFTVDGGLFSYGPDWSDAEFAPRVVAIYVDKILKGAAPGDLPIQQPTRLELVINLRTAGAIGLSVPKAFLNRADEVIR